MSKKKVSNHELSTVIYRSIYKIIEDETGNASYRKYFDKVIKDIFGFENLITDMMMASNQFRYIVKLLEDDEYKEFCQMLLRAEDVDSLYDLVRVAYDAAQIANKPKKRVTSKDIKSYRYLSDLYGSTIKMLRKKYKGIKDTKKGYKSKYSHLNKLVNKKSKTHSYHYNLSDDDESFGDLFEDDEEEEENDDFESVGFDLDDLPSQFVIGEDTHPTPKRKMILDGEEDEPIELYDGSEADKACMYPDSTVKFNLMPPEEFQKYSMSLYEKILNKLDDLTSRQEEQSCSQNNPQLFNPEFSDDQITWHRSPVDENATRYPYMYKDGYLYHNEGGFNIDGSKIETKFDEDDPIFTEDIVVIEVDDLSKIPVKEFYKLKDQDGIYYTDEDGNHPVNTDTGEIDFHSTVIFNTESFDSAEEPKNDPPKNYEDMTREEIINEFNSSNVAELAREGDITKPEKIESTSESEGKLTQ